MKKILPSLMRSFTLPTLVLLAGFLSPVVHAQSVVAGKNMKFSDAAHRLDERGFIQVWALRQDSIRASSILPAQDECDYPEENGEEEEQLKLLKSKKARQAFARQLARQHAAEDKAVQACQRVQARVQANYNAMRKNFNLAWLPALKQATAKGDPVAEVILRLCETSSVLDRTGIASDCSDDAGQKQIAKQRLQEIGFQPALHAYQATQDNTPELLTPCKQSEQAARSLCVYQRQADRYTRLLKVMRSAYLAVEESHNTCQMDSKKPEELVIIEDCQRQMNLMRALAVRAKRFYTAGRLHASDLPGTLHSLSLERPLIRDLPGRPDRPAPFDHRGDVTRNNFKAFSDPDFYEKFYAELDAMLQETEANITADVAREPRWGVFLLERINGQLFDAMDSDYPQRPTAAQIATYDYESPWQKAMRADQERLAYTQRSMEELIASLHTSRNEALWYSWERFPLNLKEIDHRATDVAAVAKAYYADHDDAWYRFNLIMILNHKPRQELSDTERQLLQQCLVDALEDKDPFVRMEATYQPRLFGERLKEPRVKQLFDRDHQEQQDYMRKEKDRQ